MSDTMPVIRAIGEREIKDSLADPAFFEAMPEFLPLKSKMEAMKTDLTVKKGCSSCAKRRVYNSLSGNYLSTVASLRPDGAERLKRYFKADGLRATMLDPVTRLPKTVRL